MTGDVLDSSRAGGVVIRGSALRIVGFAVGTGLAAFATALLLRHLGVVDAGRYTTVFALMAIVTGLADAGMTNIAVRDYATLTGEERREAMRDILGVRLTMTVAGVALALGVALLAGYTEPMIAGTALAGLGLVFTVLFGMQATPLAAELRLGTVTALELLRNAATSLALVALVLAGAGIVPLLAVPLPVGLLLLLVTLRIVRGSMPLRPSVDPRRWGRLMREVLPYAAATAVGFIYVNLTIVVLDFVAGDVEVGLFGAAFRVFIVLAGASALIAQTVFPLLTRAARDDRARLGYQVQRLLEGCLIVGAVAGLGTFFAAPVAIDVLTGGGEFEGSVEVLELQGIAFAATFPAGVAGFALLAMRRYRELLAVNAAALLVSLAVTLALADAVGAATANIAGEATLLAGCIWALMRGPAGLRLRPGLAPRALAATAAGAAAGALSPGPAVLETAVALAAFGLALLILRGVPAEIRQAFAQRD